jgi:hypothetical protein
VVFIECQNEVGSLSCPVSMLLVVEPDYLPDSEVFVFNHVYTP